jgi:CRP/FNR family transcriptional regulator
VDTVFNEICAYIKDELSAFNFLSAKDAERLSAFFQCKIFPAGNTLWNEGDPCGYVAFIISGRVKIMKKTGLKGNQVVLGIHGKGAYVGALCILDSSPRVVTAEALDDVSVILITRENFEGLIKMYPDLGTSILKGMFLSVSKRLKNSFERLIAIF